MRPIARISGSGRLSIWGVRDASPGRQRLGPELRACRLRHPGKCARPFGVCPHFTRSGDGDTGAVRDDPAAVFATTEAVAVACDQSDAGAAFLVAREHEEIRLCRCGVAEGKGHDLMITEPQGIADALVAVAAS